jgi:hypothetical protein
VRHQEPCFPPPPFRHGLWLALYSAVTDLGCRRLRAFTVIRWNETEFVEFFGVVPTFYDDAHSYGIELSRDGLRLLLTLFDLEGAVYVSIYRDGIPDAIVDVVREHCTHAFVSAFAPGRRCLQIGSREHPTTDTGILPVLTRGIRVFIEPHFRLEFIDIESRNDAA